MEKFWYLYIQIGSNKEATRINSLYNNHLKSFIYIKSYIYRAQSKILFLFKEIMKRTLNKKDS